MLSNRFFTKLNEVSGRLGMNPRDLLLVMYLESGVNPAAKHPKASAQGLLGFMDFTLKGMGLSKDEIKNFKFKPAEDQLDYVERLVKTNQRVNGGRPFSSATQYQHANFFPATLHRWKGTDPAANANVIVAAKDASSPKERQAYEWNTTLDHGKKGAITVGDLSSTLMARSRSAGFQSMLKRLNEVAGPGTVSDLSKTKQKPAEIPQSSDGSDVLVDKLMTYLNKYIDTFANDTRDKLLISIGSGSDFSSKLEFARVLSLALKEELNIKSETYSNGDGTEIVCYSNKLNEVRKVCGTLSNVFKDATKKIGGVKIITLITPNVVPHYQELGIKVAEFNYTKFHTLFLKDRNGN